MNVRNIIIIGFILSLIIFTVFVIIKNTNGIKEGLDINQTYDIPKNGIIPDGYYKVTIKDESTGKTEFKMAKVPYGYRASSDKMKLIPTSQSAIMEELSKSESPIVPQDADLDVMKLKNGDKVWANYQKKDVWHPGTISKVNKNISGDVTSYDVLYDDKLLGTEQNIVPIKGLASDLKTTILINKDTKKTTYDVADVNVQYHETAQEIEHKLDANPSSEGSWKFYDNDGKEVIIPRPKLQGDITYYQPGTFPYGPSNYVPNYEDSIYLSKLTHMSTVAPIGITGSDRGGICEKYKNDPMKLEQACNAVDKNTCASTDCCVLLGGAKCVSGDKSGPIYSSNYGDIFIRNKDLYYYQGKCYGNCPDKQIYDIDNVKPNNPSGVMDRINLLDEEIKWKPVDAYDSILNPNKQIINENVNKPSKWKLYDNKGKKHTFDAPDTDIKLLSEGSTFHPDKKTIGPKKNATATTTTTKRSSEKP